MRLPIFAGVFTIGGSGTCISKLGWFEVGARLIACILWVGSAAVLACMAELAGVVFADASRVVEVYAWVG